MGGGPAFLAEVPRHCEAELPQGKPPTLSKYCKKLKRPFPTFPAPSPTPRGNQLMAKKKKKYSNKIGYGFFIYKSFEHHPCMKRTFKYS